MFCPLWHNQWEKNDATWFIQQSSISATNQISTFSGLGDPTFRCPRVPSPGYQLLNQSSPYQFVLPRSGATRLKQPAGPIPFNRARSLLQINFSLLRDFGDPATRELSSGSARRWSIVGGELNSSSEHFVFAKVGYLREESSKVRFSRTTCVKGSELILNATVCAAGVWCTMVYTR